MVQSKCLYSNDLASQFPGQTQDDIEACPWILSDSSQEILSFNQELRDKFEADVINETKQYPYIYIEGDSLFIAQASKNNWPGNGTPSSPILIDDFNISGSYDYNMITILDTNLYFRISNCIINQGEFGIYLENVTNGQLSNNIITNNCLGGIEILYSRSITLFNNIVVNSSRFGIRLITSGNSTLTNNVVTDNSGNGIWLSSSEDSIISDNVVTNNTKYGIRLTASFNNTLSGNTINNNNQSGVSLRTSENCILSDNSINDNNGDGISFKYSENSMISNNTLTNNYRYGVSLRDGSVNNRVLFNEFSGNIDTGSQAVDNGSNNIFVFNYWSDWTTPDNDTDGIVDESYPIAGSVNNQDIYPLTSSNLPQNHFIFGLTVSHPNGEETFSDEIAIFWTDGVDSWAHSITYSVSFSADGGTSWVTLESGFTGTMYIWDITTVPNGTNYLIKVNASCADGVWNTDTSDNTFTIINFGYTTITTTLVESTSTSVNSTPSTRTNANGFPGNVIGGLIITVLITVALILQKGIIKRKE